MVEQLRSALDVSMRGQLVQVFRAQVRVSIAELVEAIHEGDHAERRRLAHGLKGSSATIGASRLARLCERLEGGPHASGGASEIARLRQAAEETLGAVAEALA